MSWERTGINRTHQTQTLLCKKCKSPLVLVHREDGAVDFPMRYVPHECKRIRKVKDVKIHENPALDKILQHAKEVPMRYN